MNGISWTTCYIGCKNIDKKLCFNELTLAYDVDENAYVEDKLIKLWNELN